MQEIRDKIKKFRPTSQKVDFFDPNINEKSSHLYKFNDGKGNKFKIWIFTDKIKLETPLTTSLLFSINIPDIICFANKYFKNINGIGKLFTDKSKDKQIELSIELLKEDLKSLCFDRTEGLTVYGNLLQLTLRNDRQILHEIEVCEKIKTIIELNFPEKIYSVDYTDLPTDLKQLIIKFECWAIPDDFERDEKSKEMTKKERNELIKAFERKFNDINLFLDTFGDKPLTDGAIKLQCLAEMAMELKLR
jgi:hypothetical protein